MLRILQCYVLVMSLLQAMKQEWTGFLFSKGGIPDDQSSDAQYVQVLQDNTWCSQNKLHSLCSTGLGGLEAVR